MKKPVRPGPTLLGLMLLGIAWARPASGQSEAPIAPLAPEPPPAASETALLRPGETVTLRVRQVIPCDGLTPGERLLSGRPAIMPGDRVVAEDVRPGVHPPALIGGTIVHIAPPKRFAKPGRVTLELGQLVQAAPGRSELVPWVFDLEDRRFNVQMRRRLMLALFAAEGAGIGASLGAQAGPSNPAYLGLGAGVGLAHGHWIRQPDARARGEPGTRRHLQDHRRHAVVSAPRPVAAALASPRAGPGEAHEGARTMSRAWPVIALSVAAVLASTGCERPAVAPAGDLPPAYTRDKILDPKLAEVARAFIAWAGEQKVQAGAVFGRVEVLPPAPTLLPYGIGTYQKQLRLPAILITGPGWRALAADDREALAARAFQELSRLLESTASASGVRATVTVQTPQGLELCWINTLEPGRKLLHGEDE